MNFNHVLKRMFSILLVFLLVFSTLSLPITLGAEPALALSKLELTYLEPNPQSFYKKIASAVAEKKDIVIHTNFINYSEFPDDLKDFIVQTKEGNFRLNPDAQVINIVLGQTVWAVGTAYAGAFVCAAAAMFLQQDPVTWGSACAGLAGVSTELLGVYRAYAQYNYLVVIDRGNIFLNVVYK